MTVQNKVTVERWPSPRWTELERGFVPGLLGISGLAYHHYEGGPWRLGKRMPFVVASPS